MEELESRRWKRLAQWSISQGWRVESPRSHSKNLWGNHFEEFQWSEPQLGALDPGKVREVWSENLTGSKTTRVQMDQITIREFRQRAKRDEARRRDTGHRAAQLVRKLLLFSRYARENSTKIQGCCPKVDEQLTFISWSGSTQWCRCRATICHSKHPSYLQPKTNRQAIWANQKAIRPISQCVPQAKEDSSIERGAQCWLWEAEMCPGGEAWWILFRLWAGTPTAIVLSIQGSSKTEDEQICDARILEGLHLASP